jgi:hypothetical protein
LLSEALAQIGHVPGHAAIDRLVNQEDAGQGRS